MLRDKFLRIALLLLDHFLLLDLHRRLRVAQKLFFVLHIRIVSAFLDPRRINLALFSWARIATLRDFLEILD